MCAEGEMVGAWYQPNDASKLAMAAGDKVAIVDLASSGPVKVIIFYFFSHL